MFRVLTSVSHIRKLRQKDNSAYPVSFPEQEKTEPFNSNNNNNNKNFSNGPSSSAFRYSCHRKRGRWGTPQNRNQTVVHIHLNPSQALNSQVAVWDPRRPQGEDGRLGPRVLGTAGRRMRKGS